MEPSQKDTLLPDNPDTPTQSIANHSDVDTRTLVMSSYDQVSNDMLALTISE